MRFTTRRRFFAVGLALLIALGLVAHSRATSAQATGGRVRFVHGVPGAPGVDISVDNVVAARDVEYASATRFLNVPAGDHAISIAATGTTNAIFKGKVTSAAGQAQTVLLQGTLAAVELGVYDDDLGPVAAGNTRMTAINALKDTPSIDIVKGDGSPLIQTLQYGTPFGGFDIPAMASGFGVVPTGGDPSGALLKIDNVSLAAGTHNTLVILGTASGAVKPSALLLTAPTDAADPAANIHVRFVHAAVGGQPVDVYAGDKLIVPALAFGAATPHIALDASAGQLSVRAAGAAVTDPALAALVGPLTLKASTVVIAAAGSGVALEPANDDLATLDPKTARINVINATGTAGANGTVTAGSASLKLGDNITLAGNAPQANLKATEVPAGVYDASVTVDKPAIQISNKLALSGGVLYDLVITGDDKSSQLIVAASGLNEQLSSAPGTPGSAVAQADTPAAPPTDVVQPTQAATAVAAAPTATVAPTDAPPAPTDAPPPPTNSPDVVPADATTSSEVVGAPTNEPDQATPVPQGIIGTVVNMNEGTNLKIREYPRTDARTLALVPSGSTFNVQGVRGPSASTATAQAVSKTTATPGPTSTLSAEGVISDNLWLYISWDVPAGGNVVGWVSAQFVAVERDGKPLKTSADLLTLRLIPQDLPGELGSSSITPVAETNQIIATIDQINEGTNLQMRRTPGIDGESLALIPAKAQAVVLEQTEVKGKGLVGEPASSTWLWVRYSTDSGSVTGWINSQYVTLTRNGRKLPDMKDIPVSKTIQRGFTEGNAQTAKPPASPGIVATVNKINQGSNLQLRRDPNANAESLGLIPAGSELPVQGRNADGNWLQVAVQGQTGWINSQYITLTKNGKAYKIDDLTIVTGEKNLIGTVTPGPSPTATLTPQK